MPVDEQIAQTAIVKITGHLDTNIICGMCSVETFRLVGWPQLYIAETGEPICSICADEQAPAFTTLLSLFIITKEFFGEQSGICDDEVGFLAALEKLRPLMERHIAFAEARNSRTETLSGDDEEETVN